MSIKVPDSRIKERYLIELDEVDEMLSKISATTAFNLLRHEAARAMVEKTSPTWTPEELQNSNWAPFHGFYFKSGWSRVIFHDCTDGIRPYVCGDTIDFAGCKICEKTMPPEVWAARELLRDWKDE